MADWDPTTLAAIASTDDFHIAPHRANGVHGTPTWIWSVVLDGDLYVRAYNGTSSSWHRSALEQATGIIQAVGSEHDVRFEPVDVTDPVQDRIDGAYRAKYDPSPYVAPMLSARSREATVKVTPQG